MNVGSGGGAAAPAAGGAAAGGDAAAPAEEEKEEGASSDSLSFALLLRRIADYFSQRRRSPTRIWASVSSTKESNLRECFLASLYFSCMASGFTQSIDHTGWRGHDILRPGQSSFVHTNMMNALNGVHTEGDLVITRLNEKQKSFPPWGGLQNQSGFSFLIL